MAANDPWWLINATSGNPPQYVIVQNGTKPQPANSAFTVTGPYPSQAVAQARVPSGAKVSVQQWDSVAGTFGAIATATGKGVSGGLTGNVNLGNPFTEFSDIATALSAFYAKLTDGKMWRSLGWLVLGVALIIVGLLMWIGPAGLAASPYGRAFTAVRGARA